MAEDFAAAPKVVKPKQKYKEQAEEQQQDEIKLIYNNLMWDKRVFRGNTYSAIVISKKNDPQYDQKTRPMLKTIRPAQQTTNTFDNQRANIEIFTDELVETLTDKPPRYQYASQTEPLPEPPVLRHFMPQKLGLDIQTQIWDKELFDFDYEVEPLLNVLCGRTLEISRMQVLQDEELRIMSNRQQELRLYEKEENKKIQNMYEQQEKLQRENLDLIKKMQKVKEGKVKTHKKVFSRVLAKQFLKDIKTNTVNYVQGNGYFRNPIQNRIINEVLPKFYSETLVIANEDGFYTQQAHKILEEAKQVIIKEHAWAKEVEKTRRQQIVDKRNEQAREKHERKTMKGEEQWMRKFLEAQKVFLAEEEQRRRLEEEKEEAEGNEQS